MFEPLVIYVDVDDTFVRSHSNARIPMPNVIAHIQELKTQGAVMYCWSSGGAEYARSSAIECGIEKCFEGFLPKPNVSIDDMPFSRWNNLIELHPNECVGMKVTDYKEKLNANKTKL